jgi:hypothetical protein
MEQDFLPFLIVLAAIFAAMLALAALFVPAEATAPAASVEGSADQGTATAAAAGPDVGDGDTGVRVGACHRRDGRPSRGLMFATGCRT